MKLIESPENTTLTLNNFAVKDIPDDEFIVINFLNPVNLITNGLTGTTIVRKHPASESATLDINITVGSDSYAFFVNARNYLNPVIFNGELRIERSEISVDGKTSDITEVFALKGGALTTSNSQTISGVSPESALMKFTIQFRTVVSTISNNV